MKRIVLIGILILALGYTVGALAAPAGFTLDWWTVDGGGGTSSGGGYTLSGTIGQADAGTYSGDGYTLYGGFWAPARSIVYLPIVTE